MVGKEASSGSMAQRLPVSALTENKTTRDLGGDWR
jgi:hypothetical protein